MFKFETIARTTATIACTLVFSAACVLGAVAPAHVTAAPSSDSVAVGPLA
ncbi:hypothetical protein ACFO8O_03925 [Hephaestia sp. GCM10023244]|nr:hypothetical protein [Hephaestia sp. MAHUQ-44]MCM8730118.1 hypothetical protein [Hephaestia sp. MAHUQ-44]